jgi:hypothetical protein
LGTARDAKAKVTGHFSGFVDVKSKDEEAVMQALIQHGPLSVGVDASFDEFLFYRQVKGVHLAMWLTLSVNNNVVDDVIYDVLILSTRHQHSGQLPPVLHALPSVSSTKLHRQLLIVICMEKLMIQPANISFVHQK